MILFAPCFHAGAQQPTGRYFSISQLFFSTRIEGLEIGARLIGRSFPQTNDAIGRLLEAGILSQDT